MCAADFCFKSQRLTLPEEYGSHSPAIARPTSIVMTATTTKPHTITAGPPVVCAKSAQGGGG